jgi:hypothetical protein
MSDEQWRTIRKRTTTITVTSKDGRQKLFWFEEPEGFRLEEGRLPPDVPLHGPFDTEAEVRSDIRRTFLGPDREVIPGGDLNETRH